MLVHHLLPCLLLIGGALAVTAPAASADRSKGRPIDATTATAA